MARNGDDSILDFRNDRSAAGRADRCVHPRPFPEDFEGCPTYRPERFAPFDSQNRELTPQWTCAHLGIEKATEPPMGYYARCHLGGPHDRNRWLHVVGHEDLAAHRRLTRAVEPVMDPILSLVSPDRRRRFHVMAERERPTATTAEIRAVAAQCLHRASAQLDAQPWLLAEAGFHKDAFMALLEGRIEHLISGPEGTPWEAPEELLRRLPGSERAMRRRQPAPVESPEDGSQQTG